MRLKVVVLAAAAVMSACSADESALPAPETVIDLYDPCTSATTEAIVEAVGFPMLRADAAEEDADRFRSCRWVAGGANTDPASIDYLEVAPRPYVDIVLRQTGVDDEAGVDRVFSEVQASGGSRPEPSVLATAEAPRLADDALRTDKALWAIKGDRMLIILTDNAEHLDALIASVAAPLLERL